MTYAEVAITKNRTGGKFYTYHSEQQVKIGAVVEVSYGRGSTKAIVVSIVKKPTFITKEITHIYDNSLPLKSLELLKWMIDFYPDDKGVIASLFIPQVLTKNPRAKTVTPKVGEGKPLPAPNKEQQAALKIIKTNTPRVLLHGDTGSGKTRVFIEQVNNKIAAGRSVLILTPEIGLTPQIEQDLIVHSAAPFITFHSNITATQRRHIWQYAATSNTPSIYIGPRSALFLPINDLGLIVMDESHDASYKQQNTPRYQSMHVASKLAQLHEAQIIQSTATPNVADLKQALDNNYHYIRMKDTPAGVKKNTIHFVDLSNRNLFTKDKYLSNKLIDAISEAIANDKQALLFLNRRGSARLVQCSECGWTALCDRCNLPLTYHQDIHSLVCHTCGFSQTPYSSCPECQSTNIKFSIIGTKTLLETTQKLFPKAHIKRFDTDSHKEDHLYKQIEELKSGDVDIIIGTQMITKGMDLKKLSVVGIINADSALSIPDFSAEEVSFQQLYQVVGRAERGHTESTTIIQTRNPKSPILHAVLNRDYEAFYTYELNKRKMFKYPPYCHLAVFHIKAKNAALAEKKAHATFSNIRLQFPQAILLGPTPSFYEKSNDYYQWNFVAKSSKRSVLVDIARRLPDDWVSDINPISLL
jgi:primosomal protein N' (replication factor Y)